MVVLRRRSHQRQLDIDLVWARTAHLMCVPQVPSTDCAGGAALVLEGELDPAAGDLNEGRASRKRDQIFSAAAHALNLMEPGDNAVEFGAGSGHLGLLIASSRPDCTVTLVEIKEYTCDMARERVARLGLVNCKVFCGSVDQYAATGEEFHVAVGLHCCGLLTDSVLELAAQRRAAVCMVPCWFSPQPHARLASAVLRVCAYTTLPIP